MGSQKKAGAHIRPGYFLFTAQSIHHTFGLLVASAAMGCFSGHWSHRPKSKSCYLFTTCAVTLAWLKMWNEASFSGVSESQRVMQCVLL